MISYSMNRPRMCRFPRRIAVAVVVGTVLVWRPALLPSEEIQADPARTPQSLSQLKAKADALKAEQYAIGSQLLKEFPDEFEVLRIMGYVHSSHGNLEEMAACWQRCRALQPDRADIYDQLGRYALRMEKYDDAVRYWQQARAINPDLPDVLENIGDAWLRLGRTDDAVEVLTQATKLEPSTSQAHFLLGEAYFQLGDFSKAKACYQRAAAADPEHVKAVYGLVKVCARLEEPDQLAVYAERFQALEAAGIEADQEYRSQYDDLREMREKLAATCTDAGRVYLRHGNMRQAEQLWLRAAELDQQGIACRSLLASLCMDTRRAPDALRLYQELLQIEPNNAALYQKLGFLHARLGNLSEAETALRQTIKAAPRSAAGYRTLAKFYLNTNQRPSEAKQLADQAMKLEPVAESYFVLGWANAKTGKRQPALAALQNALRLNPDNATYRQLYEAVRRAPAK